MATKTITLELDAYEKLRRAKRSPRESFSSVVRRGHWGSEASTGRSVLAALEALRDTKLDVLLDDVDLEDIERRATSRSRRERTA